MQGFFIVRNSEWTRRLLDDWWNIADRSVLCDQDAFNMLYARYLKEEEEGQEEGTGTRKKRTKGQGQDKGSGSITERVKILAMDSLNRYMNELAYCSSYIPISLYFYTTYNISTPSTPILSSIHHTAILQP
jgi:hypothetical protein